MYIMKICGYDPTMCKNLKELNRKTTKRMIREEAFILKQVQGDGLRLISAII